MNIEELYQLRRIEPNIANIKEVLKKLGNPERDFKSIHIKGTNGKGSTSVMIYNYLKNNGVKVGLYTSPHLVKFNERIRISGKLIDDKEIDYYLNKIKPYIKKLTFFEIATIMAFLHFKKHRVDIAVIEVGMGGKWDATNVISPEISIITRIGEDHNDYLGDKDSIVHEKSGIIKKGKTIITLIDNYGIEYIKRVAKMKESKIILTNYENKINREPHFPHQIENASLAVEALKEIGYKVNERVLLKEFYWPGRYEYHDKDTLIDVAHNLDGMKWLISNLPERKIAFFFSCMKDKDYKKMIKLMEKKASKIIFMTTPIERSMKARELSGYCNIEHYIIDDIYSAFKKRKELHDDLCVFCGSIYMVGELYKKLKYRFRSF